MIGEDSFVIKARPYPLKATKEESEDLIKWVDKTKGIAHIGHSVEWVHFFAPIIDQHGNQMAFNKIFLSGKQVLQLAEKIKEIQESETTGSWDDLPF